MAGDKLSELSAYPCPTHMHHHDVCDAECAWRAMCELKPIYDAHIALRAAVLGEMTGEEAGALYKRAGEALIYQQDTPEQGDKLGEFGAFVAKL